MGSARSGPIRHPIGARGRTSRRSLVVNRWSDSHSYRPCEAQGPTASNARLHQPFTRLSGAVATRILVITCLLTGDTTPDNFGNASAGNLPESKGALAITSGAGGVCEFT